jgi:hypothetical protein
VAHEDVSATVSSGNSSSSDKWSRCRALGLERAGERHLLAVDADAALVGPVHTGDDLDERRFSGAVLAEQRSTSPARMSKRTA